MRKAFPSLLAAALALVAIGCGARGTRDVEKLLEDLTSGSERRQRQAERSLTEHGRAMIKPLASIITGEDAEDELEMSEARRLELRVPAARALGVMAEHASLARSEAENAAAPLLVALKDKDRALRIQAVTSLGHFTQLSSPVNDVVLLLRETDEELVKAAVEALRRNALQSIDRIALPDEPVVVAGAKTEWSRLVERLGSTDDDIRLEAVRELGRRESARAAPLLLKHLATDPGGDVRYAALRLCLAAAAAAPEAPFVAKLHQQMATSFAEDADSRVALLAAQTLADTRADLVGGFLGRVQQAVKACDERLRDDAGEGGRMKYAAATRSDAVLALRNLHSKERDQLLAELVSQKNGEAVRIRRAAARVLANATTSEAVGALREAMQDDDSIVKLVAAQALGRRGDLDAVKYLIVLLSHKETKIRTPAADGLGTLGAKALGLLVEQLGEALDEAGKLAQWQVPLAELEGKKQLSDDEQEKAERLREAIAAFKQKAGGRDERHIAWGITSGIGDIAAEIGSAAAPALEVILRASLCHYAEVRRVAAKALGSFEGKKAIAALAAALSDPDDTVRWYAATSLEKHGTAAVAALIAALGDGQTAGPRAAALAAATLARIGDPAALKPLTARCAARAGETSADLVWALGEVLHRNADAVDAAAARKALIQAAQSAKDAEVARLARHALAKSQ